MGLDEDIRALKAEVKLLRDQVTEHRVRLSNGQHAMTDLRDSVTKVDGRVQSVIDQIQPKAPSIAKIVGITMTAVLAGGTALWALSNILNSKTDEKAVESIIERKMSGSQVEHRGFQLRLESLETRSTDQAKKLEELDKRQPPPANSSTATHRTRRR